MYFYFLLICGEIKLTYNVQSDLQWLYIVWWRKTLFQEIWKYYWLFPDYEVMLLFMVIRAHVSGTLRETNLNKKQKNNSGEKIREALKNSIKTG